METASQVIDLQETIQGVGGAFTLTIIAFTVVFLVLGGLTGIIYGIKYLAGGLERKQGGGSAPAPSAHLPTSAPAPASAGGDGRLLAVIAGAVAAYGGGKYSVTSVRPAGSARAPLGGDAWRQAAIYQSLGGINREWK